MLVFFRKHDVIPGLPGIRRREPEPSDGSRIGAASQLVGDDGVLLLISKV
jgi:hypothetical protein